MTIRIQVTFNLYPSCVHESLFPSKVEQLDLCPAVPRPLRSTLLSRRASTSNDLTSCPLPTTNRSQSKRNATRISDKSKRNIIQYSMIYLPRSIDLSLFIASKYGSEAHPQHSFKSAMIQRSEAKSSRGWNLV